MKKKFKLKKNRNKLIPWIKEGDGKQQKQEKRKNIYLAGGNVKIFSNLKHLKLLKSFNIMRCGYGAVQYSNLTYVLLPRLN
jgi:hypothetical protein